MRRLLALLALVAAAALLAGCGGDGGGAEGEIVETLEEGGETRDPTTCTRLFTLRFMEQTTKLRGEAAIRKCEEDTLENPPTEEIEITDVEVDGDDATAALAFEGGNYNGQTLEVALIENESWKLNEIVRFIEFDREQLVLAYRRELHEEAETPAETEYVECFLSELEAFDDGQLEALIVEFSSEPLYDILRACQPHSASA